MSMFSQTTEYALRAIVWLAAQGSNPQTTRQIAAATHVPPGYLSKVLQSLGRAGLVHSQRGLHGGFVLVRDPTTIRVIDVVNAVDPIRRIHSCPLELKTHGAELCPLHRRMDDAMAHIEQALSESTVADLLAEPAGSRPLCDSPETS
jgi:Rrf2 family nitric oxide-sensitive transcriptional repressor